MLAAPVPAQRVGGPAPWLAFCLPTLGHSGDTVVSLRGIDPYDKPNTVYVERHEPSGYSTVLRSTDFFQSRENQEVILEAVRDFQLRDKYLFATKVVVSEGAEDELRGVASLRLGVL